VHTTRLTRSHDTLSGRHFRIDCPITSVWLENLHIFALDVKTLFVADVLQLVGLDARFTCQMAENPLIRGAPFIVFLALGTYALSLSVQAKNDYEVCSHTTSTSICTLSSAATWRDSERTVFSNISSTHRTVATCRRAYDSDHGLPLWTYTTKCEPW
jgi:hypothetical protein